MKHITVLRVYLTLLMFLNFYSGLKYISVTDVLNEKFWLVTFILSVMMTLIYIIWLFFEEEREDE